MFKVGDKVIRTGDDFCNVRQGNTYSIVACNGLKVWLEDIDEPYAIHKFKLVEDDMKIKITKWEDLKRKTNPSEEFIIDVENHFISINNYLPDNTFIDDEISNVAIINYEEAGQLYTIDFLKAFGFEIEFTEPIKLTKAEYYFIRFVFERYNLYNEPNSLSRKKAGCDLTLFYGDSQIIVIEDSADLLEFIGNRPWSIESLRELGCEEET